MDDTTLEGDALAFKVCHEAIKILDPERDSATGAIAGLFLSEVGEG
jgi:hypothetical protein